MIQTNYYSAIAGNEKVDGTSGIISGVSVITLGEAAGKNSGTFIDRTTLNQIADVAKKYPDGVKVKLSQNKEHDGSAGQIVGVLKSFRVDGDRVRADLHLLKSDDNFAKIIEMSQSMPSEFGLSIVIPKEIEKIDKKECLRCSEIYSIDLVEAPAANPNGLFSAKPNMTIKYAKGDSGEHDKECECKECMSKHSKKEMSAMIAGILGLSAEATDEEISTAFKASRGDNAAVLELAKKIEEATTELTRFKTANAEIVALTKKNEIAALVAEASRDGKQIPLTDVQLSKMEVADIKEMITKLPKTVQMTRRPIESPKTTDGKVITDRRSPEFKAFAASRLAQGARELGELILNQNSGLTRN